MDDLLYEVGKAVLARLQNLHRVVFAKTSALVRAEGLSPDAFYWAVYRTRRFARLTEGLSYPLQLLAEQVKIPGREVEISSETEEGIQNVLALLQIWTNQVFFPQIRETYYTVLSQFADQVNGLIDREYDTRTSVRFLDLTLRKVVDRRTAWWVGGDQLAMILRKI